MMVGGFVGRGVGSTMIGVISNVDVGVGGRGVEVAVGSGVSVRAGIPGVQAARMSASKTIQKYCRRAIFVYKETPSVNKAFLPLLLIYVLL